MGKPPNPNIDDYNSDLDPFAETPQAEQEDAAEDPFNFDSGPAPARPASPPPRNKASASAAPVKTESRALGMTADVPVQLAAVMGKKTITVKEVLSLKKGQVIELNRFPNEAIDLVANGKLMAKGELVEVDGKLGVRIIKIFE